MEASSPNTYKTISLLFTDRELKVLVTMLRNYVDGTACDSVEKGLVVDLEIILSNLINHPTVG